MDELVKEKFNIERMIYEIRGRQVMLDSDLAKLYNVTTGNLNKAVKRNINRFPDDFYFQLTLDEYKFLMFQNGISKIDYRRINKSIPHVFTEQGIAMLSSVLKTDIASEVSINIMRAFVAMRKYISSNLIEQKYINNQVMKNTEDIKLLQESFSKFEEKKIINEIYFNGQIYDAYSKITDIFKEAKEELVIIDAYADKTTLDMIKELDVEVTLIVKENARLKELDITKYQEQYDNLKVIYDNTFHDRYFIIDKDTVYHSGTSVNNAGSKTFSINKIEDEIVKNAIKEKINNLRKIGC